MNWFHWFVFNANSFVLKVFDSIRNWPSEPKVKQTNWKMDVNEVVVSWVVFELNFALVPYKQSWILDWKSRGKNSALSQWCKLWHLFFFIASIGQQRKHAWYAEFNIVALKYLVIIIIKSFRSSCDWVVAIIYPIIFRCFTMIQVWLTRE